MQKNFNNLGNKYRGEGKTELAKKYYLKATKQYPDLPQPYNNLARIYFEQKQFKKSIIYAKKAISKDPNWTSAYSIMGASQMMIGDTDAAITSLKTYVKLNPDAFEEYFLLGDIYANLGNQKTAKMYYLRSISQNREFTPAYSGLGNLFKNNHDLKNAYKYYSKGLQYMPDSPIVLTNLGVVLQQMGKVKKAQEIFERVILLNPDYADAQYSLGKIYLENNDYKRAKKYFTRTLIINPDFGYAKSILAYTKMQTCDWDETFDYDPLYDTPLVNLLRCEDPKINLKVAQAWSKNIENKNSHYPKFHYPKPKQKKLVIGYISNDFYEHATSFLISGMFGLHDKKRFKINVYSYGQSKNNLYINKIKKDCSKFSDISDVSDYDAAAIINYDNVDILVDLKGYTGGSRLDILALRPAPIEISYLGFPSSTGSGFIDYVITDKVVTPPDLEKYFTEKLIFMPHSYQVNDSDRKISSKIFTRADFGLPDKDNKVKVIVFCSFCQPSKIEKAGFSLWMNILNNVPTSVLWLLNENPLMVKNLKKEAGKSGVDPSRLVFTPSLPHDEHLKRLTMADIALDTFTYNGHTTTSDCLWAGVPVITMLGNHFASRVSGSLLRAVDLPELITTTTLQYERKAVELATDLKELESIKLKLKNNRKTSALFDTEQFVYDLEENYMSIWKSYTDGSV